MPEKNLDFDTVIERKHTNSIKYDFAKRRGMPEDILPLWVADMDFRVSSYIQEAIQRQTEHGIFGYSEVQEEYFEAVQSWMMRHHDWTVDRRWMVKTPGVVYALATAVRAFTEKGDSVLIQQPVYYPFRSVILDNGRKVVDSTLIEEGNGRYRIDVGDFEDKIVKNKVKLFLLCNPHNPVGKVWTEEELKVIGDICLRHRVLVVSDEIHEDFVFRGKHQVFAEVREEYRDISVICTSPSKTFNLAGLQVSNIFIPNPELKRRFQAQMKASGYSQLNVMGLIACETAYRDGEEWYQAVMEYIRANIIFMKRYLSEKIPKIKMSEPEGTYLVWLDFREFGLSEGELETWIVKKAGLWLDGGTMFGNTGRGFQRINAACPRKTLEQALDRLEKAVRDM